ncbi:aspartate aminotransferase [Clostridium acetireducens DSM 10703]|jgi:aspartate aminotransferase|uniref:Aminotransferase n=1 Tax=Clostridium acetireducens DSM 10703 TaxID=1121290 RepID=A0A1E8F303_9CLOT|nr:pyridoxal phosphate-dependent aminotransferase [Clostridium acetireducens]OFI07763.1 aspartate aminotransferase [Clostridium acetireducens DSM 10703]
MSKTSNRINAMQFSPIRKLAPFADEAKKKGVHVYHLNIGQPDIETPKTFFEGINDYEGKVLKYAGSRGIDELVESFIKYYKGWNVDFKPENIMVTNGGSEAIFMTLFTICDVGDEIIVPAPFYTNYVSFAAEAGVKVVPFITKAEDGFHLPTKEEILAKVNDKTRAIMLSNPGNPTGVVYTKEELRMLGDIAKEKDLYLIADEVYREFVYDGLKYTSLLSFKDLEDRVIVIDSISKRYSACGARIGMAGSLNTEVMGQMMKLAQTRLCVPTIEQFAAANLINTPASYFEETNAEYDRRRNILFDGLKKIPGVICEKPTGAFYIVAKLPVKDAEAFATWMLTDFNKDGKTVMVAPAAGFYGVDGVGLDEVRLSYCLNCDDLADAMKIFAEGIAEYKKIEK